MLTQKIASATELVKLFTLHFTSKRKMMSVLVRNQNQNKNTLLVKGAAEKIIENSTNFINSDGQKEELT